MRQETSFHPHVRDTLEEHARIIYYRREQLFNGVPRIASLDSQAVLGQKLPRLSLDPFRLIGVIDRSMFPAGKCIKRLDLTHHAKSTLAEKLSQLEFGLIKLGETVLLNEMRTLVKGGFDRFSSVFNTGSADGVVAGFLILHGGCQFWVGGV